MTETKWCTCDSFRHPEFKFSFAQSPKRGLKRVTCHMKLTVFCTKKVFCEKTDLKSRLEIKQAAFQQELKHSEQTRELITTFYIPEQLTVNSLDTERKLRHDTAWLSRTKHTDKTQVGHTSRNQICLDESLCT